MIKSRKSILIFLLIGLISLSLLCSCSNSRLRPLDSDEWGYWDSGYNPYRYNMMLWLFETDWFESKTRENILKQLPDQQYHEIIDDEINFQVKFKNPNFIIGIDPYEVVGILTIYFDDGSVIHAEYKERKNADSEYELKTGWNSE